MHAALPSTLDQTRHTEKGRGMKDVRILDIAIDAPAERVYAYVAEPRNMPRWAPNFGHTITLEGDHWIMHTAEGPVPVRFAPPNELGVLDHWVRLPDGELHNPMRVVPKIGRASCRER